MSVKVRRLSDAQLTRMWVLLNIAESREARESSGYWKYLYDVRWALAE